MRLRILVLGVVLSLVALALWYQPLETISTTATVPADRHQVVGLVAPLDILGGPVSFTLDWSASFSLTAQVYRCGTSPDCKTTGANNEVAQGTGASGTLRWQSTQGVYFVLVCTGGPVQVSVQETEPLLGGTVGIALLSFGLFLVVLGVWLVPVRTDRRVPRTHRDDDKDFERVDPP